MLNAECCKGKGKSYQAPGTSPTPTDNLNYSTAGSPVSVRITMNPFESLTAENHDQLKKYLRFFAQKKDCLLRTINVEFADAKADKLNGDMYSREDVEDFCEFLASAVKVSSSGETTS